MKYLACTILAAALSMFPAQAGDFIGYGIRETRLVFHPHRYPNPDYYTDKPVTVTITVDGSTPKALKLQSGRTKFQLSAQELTGLGPCSFTECGLYAGPGRKPSHYFFHFHRVDRKGKKSPVTIHFTKGQPTEISVR